MRRIAFFGVGAFLALGLLGSSLAGRQPAAQELPPGTAGSAPSARPSVPAGCGPWWSVISSPNVATSAAVLHAVAAIAGDDVWAVGGADRHTLVEHWDGNAWSVVASPNEGGSVLEGVAAVASNDVWAVGVGDGQTLTEHWNGTAWTIVQSPSPPASDHLKAVAAVASNDVWAVGFWSSGFDLIEPLTEHWDGTAWTVVGNPGLGFFTGLDGVAAVASDDVWAVGSGGSQTQTLVEHWDGQTWSIVPSPNVGAYDYLTAVAAVARSDVWAVGFYTDPYPLTTVHTLVEHWDGRAWSVVPSPTVGTRNRLHGMTAVSAGDVWAVGDYIGSDPLTPGQTLVEHWDGSVWAVMPSPNVGTHDNSLKGVAAVSASDVWTVGMEDNGSVDQSLVERYHDACATPTPTYSPTATPTGTPPTATGTPTGTATTPPCDPDWRVASSPNPYLYGDSVLNGVAVVASNDAWAVGSYNRTRSRTLAEHWDGNSWSVVPSPNLYTDNVLQGVAVAGRNDVWAVGHWSNGLFYQTLVEHWNGIDWRVVPDPPSLPDAGQLNGVAAVASNDVWAVGFNGDQTLTEHWNGSAWSVVPSPNGGPNANVLTGVAAVSSRDIWAVGSYIDNTLGVHTLTEHWDGTEWSVVASPNVGAGDNALNGVAMVASSGVWAVGSATDYYPLHTVHTLVERWDGSGWSVVPSPNVGTGDNALTGVIAPAPNDWWAVGKYNNGGIDRTLVIHAGGVVASPNVGPHANSLAGVAAGAGSEVWAVGRSYTGSVDRTLVERYQPCLSSPTATVTRTAGPTRTPGRGGATRTVTPRPTVTACLIQFTDVANGSPFYAVIRCLACRGIVGGYLCGAPGEPCPGSYYRPNNNVTRGQVAKIVSESAGFADPVPSTQQTFADVPPSGPFWLWIERLRGREIVGGYPCGGPFEPCVAPTNRPYFRPNNNVTRGQLSKITSGAAGWTETPTVPTFEDVAVGSTFYVDVERIAGRGIAGGYPCGGVGEPCVPPTNRAYFRPNNAATRGQMSKMAALTFFPGCATPTRR